MPTSESQRPGQWSRRCTGWWGWTGSRYTQAQCRTQVKHPQLRLTVRQAVFRGRGAARVAGGSLREAWSPTHSATLSLKTKFALVCRNPFSSLEPPLLGGIH